MRKTFLVSFALTALIGSAANGSGSYDVTASVRDFSRMLRSSATTRSLPRFPEEPPMKSLVRVDPVPPRPTRIISIGQVVESIADNRVRISIGRDDGFKVGHELDVYRAEKKIARIVIREVDKVEAAAELLPDTVVEKPRTGDILRFNTADAKR